MPGLDPTALRRLNTSVVLRALAEHTEPATLATLVNQVSLSRRTVELILTSLCGSGWAVEVAPPSPQSDVGRPPRYFSFVASKALVAAVRIDTHSATAVVSDIRGQIRGRAVRVLQRGTDPVLTSDDAAQAVEAAITDSGLPRDRVHAGAAAAGGAIDEAGVVHRLVHAPDWSGFALADELTKRLTIPFVADNDANAAALAEHWRGAARDYSSFAWCILGNRSGVGIVIRGAVHRGFQGGAGEIVEMSGFRRDRLEFQPVALLTSPIASERASAARLVDAARNDDREALGAVDVFATLVARQLSMLAWTVAPDLIVLGGGLETAADVLIPRITAAMHELGTPPIALRPTSIGADAPLIGAVRLVLERTDAEFFGPTVTG
jgi:predicted NBD/HSP70 family sugar kinase